MAPSNLTTWFPQRLSKALPALFIGAGLAGCRAQMTVHTEGQQAAASTPSPAQAPTTAVPVLIANAFGPGHQYFQTRSVVTINLVSGDVGSGDSISLIDDTTSQNLIDHQPLALTGGSAEGAYDVILELYPADPDMAGAFAYGANQLRLLVNDEAQPKFAQDTVTLGDFPYFAAAGAGFADGGELVAGFEGDVDRFGGLTMTNASQETLTTGFIATMTQ